MVRLNPIWLTRLRRFGRARGGATAVEFAMIALPFMGLLIAIFEIGLIFMVANSLDDATNTVARQMRTGELPLIPAVTARDLQTRICGQIAWMGAACAEHLEIDVRTLAEETSANTAKPVVGGVLQPQGALLVDTGLPGDVVLVRAYYPWTLIAPAIDGMTDPGHSGTRLISAAAAFRNTPPRSPP